MKRLILALMMTTAIGLGFVPSATAGPLTGQVLSATGTGILPPAAVVGPGPEFGFSSTFGDPFTFDFDDDGQITLTGVIAPGDLILGSRIYTFSDLNGTIPDIIGAAFLGASGVTGLDASDVSFTANSVTINLSSTVWAGNGTRTAQFELAFAVPEPATLALLGAGLLGLGAARRRRRLA